MCKAIDVASYILQEKGRLTGYQLQKLLYYSQAWCLVTQDRPLFEEDIRAWEHGPVVYEVFCEHGGRFSIVQSDLSGNPSSLTPDDMAVVDAVLNSYGSMSGDSIEDLSHHESPWRDVYDGTSSAHSPIISDEAMVSYYSSLMAADRWTTETHHVPRFTYAPRVFVSNEEFDWLASLV